MAVTKFIIIIIGLIVCIRSKKNFSKYGTIFFLLLVMQSVYIFIEAEILIPYFENLAYNKEIEPEIFGSYVSLSFMLGELIGGASLVAIIVGVVKFRD